jgi:hypothetical protein
MAAPAEVTRGQRGIHASRRKTSQADQNPDETSADHRTASDHGRLSSGTRGFPSLAVRLDHPAVHHDPANLDRERACVQIKGGTAAIDQLI